MRRKQLTGGNNNDSNPAFVLYNKYVRKYKKLYGVKGTTYSDDLNRIGKTIFGKKFIGVFAVDRVPKVNMNEAYAIVNTDPQSKKGEHWVGLYKKGTKIYIYDSFGRESKKLLPILVKQINARGYKYVNADRLDKEQSVQERNCGVRVLGWMSVIRDLGVTQAMKI